MKIKQRSIGLLITEDNDIEEFTNFHINRFQEYCPGTTVKPYLSVRGEFPKHVEDHSCYVITGSHHSVNQPDKWMVRLEGLIREIKKRSHIRLLAICFGHQLVAKTLGGTVARNPTGHFIWSCEKVRISEKLASKEYYQNTKLESTNFYIMQSHGEQVVKVPSCGTVVGSCRDSPNEIITYGDSILTLQGHPEATVKKMLGREVILVQKSMITNDEVNFGRKSLENDQCDMTMQLISNFLMSSDPVN